jgi:D-sedoheptulose 7-phosphate isomerase
MNSRRPRAVACLVPDTAMHAHPIRDKIEETINNLQQVLRDSALISAIGQAAGLIGLAMKSGNKLMICGNGGSAADAQHVAGEFLCRFYRDRVPLPAIALSTDTSVLTSISNDYSYDQVFSRQIEALGKSGDILLGISTSGNSKNVLQAFRVAKGMGIQTILLTGAVDGDMVNLGTVVVRVPSTDTPRIQEIHLVIEHLISEIVERYVCE